MRWAFVPEGLARTDGMGRFTYVVRATRNKVVRFRYAGTRRIRGGDPENFELRVPAVKLDPSAAERACETGRRFS